MRKNKRGICKTHIPLFVLKFIYSLLQVQLFLIYTKTLPDDLPMYQQNQNCGIDISKYKKLL